MNAVLLLWSLSAAALGGTSAYKLGYSAPSFRSSSSIALSALTAERPTSEAVKDFFISPVDASKVSPTSDFTSAVEEGVQELKSIRLPLGKDEAWRHTNLKTLFQPKYIQAATSAAAVVTSEALLPFIDAECVNSNLVFVDGRFSPSLSSISDIPSSVVAASLLKIGANVREQLEISKILSFVPDKEEKMRNSYASDALTAVNLVNLQDAGVICVPAGVTVETPIQVIFCNTIGYTPTASFPRLLVRVEEGAGLRLKQSIVSLGGSARSTTTAATTTEERNAVSVISDGVIRPSSDSEGEFKPKERAGGEWELSREEVLAQTDSEKEEEKDSASANIVVGNTRVLIGRNAKVQHTYIQETALSTRHVEVISSEVSSDSSYDVAVVQSGGRISRINVHVNLTESSSNCSLNGVILAERRQSLDLHSSITHDAPAARSRQQQRNVVGDRGEAIFKGRIRIPKHAQETDSDQLCRTIMLGDRARLIAMPTLEITADNVVCSHGASVADLDENSMFYLSARGINRIEARKLLLRGFIFDVLLDAVLDKATSSRLISKLEQINNDNNSKSAQSGSQKFMSI